MSEERKIVIGYLGDKLKELERKQDRDRDAVIGASETIDWRQKRINGFKKILEELK